MSLIAIIGAIALQSFPAWAAARPDQGWNYLTINSDETSITFTRPGPKPNLIWSRNERAIVTDGAHSSMTLYELDCVNGKYRILQGMAYSLPNLGGTGTTSDYITPWSYPGPGTIGEAIFQRGCGLRD